MSSPRKNDRLALFGLVALTLLLCVASTSCIADVELPPSCESYDACGGNPGVAGASDDTAPGSAGMGGELVCDGCMIGPLRLPNPCGSDPYSTRIGIDGGTPPYTWHVDSPAHGWRVESRPNSNDGSQMQLIGQPTGDTHLRFTVTDSLGYVTRMTYDLVPRSACYFAFVYSTANGTGKLALPDPFFLTIDAAEHLANNNAVHDFQFSPDGRFLAYRFDANAAHPKGARLSLFDLSSMHDQALELDADAIDAYAWSPDSKALAVARTVGQRSWLSGIRPTSTASGTTLEPITTIEATDPIESELYWSSPEFLGYLSATTPDLSVPQGHGLRSLFNSRVAEGFGAPKAITDASYQPGSILVAPVLNGLFVTSPANETTIFNSVKTNSAFGVSHRERFIDPAGGFAAEIVDSALRTYRATNGQMVFETSLTTPEANCPKLLTWARGRERIACVAHVVDGETSWGELRIFDVGTASANPPRVVTPSIVAGSCLKDARGAPLDGTCSNSEYDYDEGSSAGQPRSFSQSGDWLAFVTASQGSAQGSLYWANLADGMPPTLSRRFRTSRMPPGSAAELSFSPSEKYLLHRSGTELWAHKLDAVPADAEDLRIDPALDDARSAPCSDDFITAPTRWCGSENAERRENADSLQGASQSFVWSRDSTSELFAYRKQGALVIIELSPHGFDTSELDAPLCTGGCSGQFDFQPPN